MYFTHAHVCAYTLSLSFCPTTPRLFIKKRKELKWFIWNEKQNIIIVRYNIKFNLILDKNII